MDNRDAPVPPGPGVDDGDMKPPRPKEAQMNMNINFSFKAVFCLLAQNDSVARLPLKLKVQSSKLKVKGRKSQVDY